MSKTMTFTYEEFDSLVREVTYELVAFDYFDEYFENPYFAYIADDGDPNFWDEWVNTYGEEAVEDVGCFFKEEELAYRMIGKKFNMIVKDVTFDSFVEKAMVIFE